MSEKFNPIPETELALLNPLIGSTMLELGRKKTGEATYKQYFTDAGYEHTSIDWKGGYGSLSLDLREPIDLGQFDMVTNIGTTEHVSDQTPVWRNVHHFCKVGGVIVSVTPLEGDWWWHGEYYPRKAFFEQFAALNSYSLDRLYVDQEAPRRCLFARMTKITEVEFSMPAPDTMYKNTMRSR